MRPHTRFKGLAESLEAFRHQGPANNAGPLFSNHQHCWWFEKGRQKCLLLLDLYGEAKILQRAGLVSLTERNLFIILGLSPGEVRDIILGWKKEVVMFVNITNHSADGWSEDQLLAARLLAEDVEIIETDLNEILDIGFPSVPAEYSPEQVRGLADGLYNDVVTRPHVTPEKAVILVQGEMTLTKILVDMFHRGGFRVVAACSTRKVEERTAEDGSTVKKSIFRFVRFRDYL